MTREEVANLLPIMQSFAEGRTVQYRNSYSKWEDIEEIFLNALYKEPQNYRIKPSPKYRPFKDAEECWNEMQKHQPFGWVKTENGIYTNILIVNSEESTVVTGLSDKFCSFNDMFQYYAFYDGTPFGVKEESEG